MPNNLKDRFWILVLFAFHSIVAIVFADNGTLVKCPAKDDIPNCKCTGRVYGDVGSLDIYCSNLTEMRTFAKQMSKFSGMNISVLMLKNFTMPYMPSGVFKGLRVKVLEIYDGKWSSLSHPSDGSPFAGLEDSLTNVCSHRVHSLEVLDFRLFSGLKKLERIDFQFTPVQTFDNWDSLSNLTSVKYFTIADTNMTALEKNALSGQKNLATVVMIFNKLESLRRDFFPRPALNLSNIMLGHNKISFVPDDTFEDMPALRYVDLSRNQLTTISQNWFQYSWSNLNGFQFRGNPLHCDSSLAWFTQMVTVENKNPRRRYNDFDYLKCATPAKFANRTVKSLTMDELEYEVNNNNRID